MDEVPRTEHADGVAVSTRSTIEDAKPGDEDECCKGFEVHDTSGYVVVVADAVDETGADAGNHPPRSRLD